MTKELDLSADRQMQKSVREAVFLEEVEINAFCITASKPYGSVG